MEMNQTKISTSPSFLSCFTQECRRSPGEAPGLMVQAEAFPAIANVSLVLPQLGLGTLKTYGE